MNQNEYVEAGVVIKRPTGLETFWQFILPPFVGRRKEALMENYHYFTSLKMLQAKYPTLESLKQIDATRIDSESQECRANDESNAKERQHRQIKRTIAYMEGQESFNMQRRQQSSKVKPRRLCQSEEKETNYHEEGKRHQEEETKHQEEKTQHQEEEQKAQEGPPPFDSGSGSEEEIDSCDSFQVDDALERAIEDEELSENEPIDSGFTSNVRELRWTTPPSINPPELSNLTGRIKNACIREATSSLEVFFQLFPLNLIEKICRYSNIHKRRYFEIKGLPDR